MESEEDHVSNFRIVKGMFDSSKLVRDRLNSIDEFSDWFGWVMGNIVEVAAKVEMVQSYILFKLSFQQWPCFRTE